MRKIDLHIHTIKTISDSEFVFSMERLRDYVESMDLDAIAITNHNVFNLKQYKEISEFLSGVIVFPGIEVNIGTNAGHIIVISEESDLKDFSEKCGAVTKEIVLATDSVSLDKFSEIFSDLDKYLLIPHYDKNPSVDSNTLEKLSKYIICGEVSSPKKFLYCKKRDGLTPVIFSDWRPTEDSSFPVKQTYIDIGTISLKSIKKSLKDKTKVQLSDQDGHRFFQALPDLKLSTGLSVIIGERSSGKTYTLNRIENAYENIKYIKQFSLLEIEPDKAETTFAREIESQNSQMIQEYFRLFSLVISEVAEIDLIEDERKVEGYIKSLIKYASDASRRDTFSKCRLFSETEYFIEELTLLEDLITSVERLLDARKYKDVIDKNVERKKLLKLHRKLIEKHLEETISIKKKKWINEVVEQIKCGLESKSSSPRIKNVDLYEVQMNRAKVRRFIDISERVIQEFVIKENNIEGFKIQVLKGPYTGAGELLRKCGKKSRFKEAFSKYRINWYEYLQALKNISEIPDKDYYLYFAKTECKILNQYGYAVSGGERAEFNLLREINDALQYDMLLIDEPESSFDNIFLKEKVNHLIKEIAEEMPVVIVTHNNTVGASIRPDYVIYTRRRIDNGKAIFEVFSGFPGDRKLIDKDGNTVQNIQATMDCLEAGKEAYEERKKEYEMLEN